MGSTILRHLLASKTSWSAIQFDVELCEESGCDKTQLDEKTEFLLFS